MGTHRKRYSASVYVHKEAHLAWGKYLCKTVNQIKETRSFAEMLELSAGSTCQCRKKGPEVSLHSQRRKKGRTPDIITRGGCNGEKSREISKKRSIVKRKKKGEGGWACIGKNHCYPSRMTTGMGQSMNKREKLRA